MTESPAKRPRVLLVEDEQLILLSAANALEEAGYDVSTAATDRAAYDALEGEAFDLLIVDIDLGEGTTGFDIARFARLKAPDLPVIYSTGDSSGSIPTFGVSNAVSLVKPYSASTLLDATARILVA